MKKKELDYLIVAPFTSIGQSNYYYERKKMLDELGYSCKILTLKNKTFFKFGRIPLIESYIILPLRYRFLLNSFLKRYKPKIIEFQNVTSFLQKDILFKKHLTIISFDHPALLNLPWYTFFIKFLESKQFKKASLLITRSQYALDILNKKFSKLIFISHSIKKCKDKQNFGFGENILYYCSPNGPYHKGLDIAILFWKDYSKQNTKMFLQIAGISKEACLRYLNKRGIRLPPKVIFLGKLRKEEYFYNIKKCKFMINTSRVEEFGRSILESVSQGKIIFTTPTTGAKEILGNNRYLISRDFSPDTLLKLINKSKESYKINLDRYLYNVQKNTLKNVLNGLNEK